MRRAAGTAVASLALLIAVPGVAGAAQRYASPGGTDPSCSQTNPCSLQQAITGAGENDEVIATGGTYTVAAAIITPPIAKNLFIHGDFAGPMPKIDATLSGAVPIVPSAVGVKLSYLDVTNTATGAFGATCQGEGVIERLRVTASGQSATGVILSGKCTVRDSLIRAVGANGVALSGSGGPSGGGQTGLIRNVTAIATGTESVGIRSSYNEFLIFGSYLLDVKNTIADGSLADLQALSGAFGPGNIAVSNSNFDKPVATGSATIAGGSNQSAPPLFVNAAAGDYRQAADSPTIDVGSTDGIGALDLDGNPRNLGAAPDIGAFEFVPPPSPVPAAGTIQSLSLKPRKFRAVNVGGAILSAQRRAKKAPVGTTVNYFVSAPTTVEFTVERVTKGRKVSGKCRKAARANRDKKKCPLFRALKPSFTHFGIHNGVVAGNSFGFSGRIGGKALRPGRYRLVGRAGDAVKRAAFEVVGTKRKRKAQNS